MKILKQFINFCYLFCLYIWYRFLKIIHGYSELEWLVYDKPRSLYPSQHNLFAYLISHPFPDPEPSEAPPQQLDRYLRAAACNTSDPRFDTVLRPLVLRHLEVLGVERDLAAAMRAMASTAYDSRNPAHERDLLLLWELLRPGRPLSARVSREWGDLGFQGSDPATDFRGMGVLGLAQLLAFARYRAGAVAQSALSLSCHPKYGFPMAITGINITAWLLQSLERGKLRQRLAEWFSLGMPAEELFHLLYIMVFDLFARFYVGSEPEDIMSFGEIFQQFKQSIESQSFIFESPLSLTS